MLIFRSNESEEKPEAPTDCKYLSLLREVDDINRFKLSILQVQIKIFGVHVFQFIYGQLARSSSTNVRCTRNVSLFFGKFGSNMKGLSRIFIQQFVIYTLEPLGRGLGLNLI